MSITLHCTKTNITQNVTLMKNIQIKHIIRLENICIKSNATDIGCEYGWTSYC